MESYKKELAKLNPLQRQAVESIDGPLLVIAGPGTGKTQLLSMRVAYILKNTDTDPGNILCLTFTNKATTNMRDRIMGIVGVEGRKVQIKTFHSFAAEIINQYPEYFWNGAKLSIAPDAMQLGIIQKILLNLPLDSPLALKFAGQLTTTDAVRNGLKLAKEAGLTPDKLRAIIQANLSYIDVIEPKLIDILGPTLSQKRLNKLATDIASLPEQDIDSQVAPLLSLKTVLTESLDFAIKQDEGTNKTKHVGQWKRRWIKTINARKSMHDERKRNAWWLELADVYEEYRRQLHARGYYDYSDMLVEVLSSLEQNPELLADARERFLYVMIDEFQDTNSAQLRLAHLVADRDSANQRPNIMAVGDDDQAIFAFNGAELNNMLFFDRNYEDVKKIVLTENYRSTQAILDTASQIIEQASDRLITRDKKLSKNLTASKPPKGGNIVHLAYPTREHQNSFVAREIKKLRSNQPNQSIAVIARSHESLKILASLLLNLGVDVRYEQRSNVLESEPITQIIILSKLVGAVQAGDKQTTNQMLATSLAHPMWQLPPEVLWQLALDNQYDGDWLSGMLSSKDKHLKDIAKLIMWLAGNLSHQPLGLALEYLLGLRNTPNGAIPIKNHFSIKNEINSSYLNTLSAIRMLRDLAREFSAQKPAKLSDFIDFVEINLSNQQVIADESPFVSSPNAVELYTVHKAKGLEFDNVFIIDAIEENWQPRSGKRKPPANLPLQPPLENDDDYARLLYVAATRAKHTLVVSSYQLNHVSQEVLASPLVRNAIPNTNTPKSTNISTETVLEEGIAWPHLTNIKEKQLLKGRLESFSVNVTNLINFLDVTRGGPGHFFERNILRLPEAKSPPMAYGTAIHTALESAQNLINSDKFELKKVLQAFSHALAVEHLPENDTLRLTKQGETTLITLFKKLGYQLPKGSKGEQRIKNIRLKTAIIDGKLDRIDFGDHLTIVDYKTGRLLPSFETKDKNLSITAWRQKTQIIFYALLARYDPRLSRYDGVEGQMVYVQADNLAGLVRSYRPSQDEIDRLERLVEAVWQKVTNAQWPDTAEYSQDLSGILAFEEDLIKGKV